MPSVLANSSRALAMLLMGAMPSAPGVLAQAVEPALAVGAVRRDAEVHDPSTVAMGGISSALIGAVVGAGVGGVAGGLFAHDACNNDPCSAGAYVVAGAAGAALIAGMGAIIGSRVGKGGAAGRNARTGTVVGALVGAGAGLTVVATTCDSGECGFAAYSAVALASAAVLGAVGGVIGGAGGGGDTASREAAAVVAPILGPSSRGMRVGVRVVWR